MATVPYSTVRDMAAKLAGHTLPVPASEAMQIATHIAIGLREIWAQQPWPELLTLAEYEVDERAVDLADGGVVLGAYDADPRANHNWRDVGWEEVGGTSLVLERDLPSVWLDLLPRKPIITDLVDNYPILDRFVNYLVFYAAGHTMIADGLAQNGAGYLKLADAAAQSEMGDFTIPRRFSKVRVG